MFSMSPAHCEVCRDMLPSRFAQAASPSVEGSDVKRCRTRLVERPGVRLSVLTSAAGRFDKFASDDVLEGVVASFDEHVGADDADDLMRRRLVEDHHEIHACQRRQHAGTFGSGHDRPTRAFELRHGLIGVDRDNQTVSLGGGLFEIRHMAGVQQVEAAVRQHDAAVLLPQFGESTTPERPG